MIDRPEHPSGRPFRRDVPRKQSILRNPGIGPLTDRLRLPTPTSAIGFHHIAVVRDEDDE